MENIKEEFEKRNNTRDWFVEGGRVDGDTPEGYVYEDFTTDMCWTCFFDAYNTQRLRADTAEGELKVVRKSRDDELENYNAMIADLAAAEKRIALMSKLLKRCIPVCRFKNSHTERDLIADINAALNPNPEAESHE